MFPEFRYIGPLLGFLMLVGLAAAVLGSVRLLFFFTLLSYLYGIAALWDFWAWGYDYGHNLDPNAAIKVPGMAYQPPLIGYKNLLNFTSFSGPDIGAWIIIVVCAMATVLWWWAYFKYRKTKLATGKAALLIALMAAFHFSACSSGPEPIQYGQDNCHACKMTLTDKRFGCEIVTAKGKVFKFDDLNCLVGYLKDGSIAEKDIAQIVVVDFNKTTQFVDVQNAFFLQSEALKSPMRADVASFSDQNELEMVKMKIGAGKNLNWNEVKAQF
jgi:copper chaperone NosL